MNNEKTYWFPAKRYGWGWGLPATWQGWLVLQIFVAIQAAGPFVFPPHERTVAYSAYALAFTLLFLAVCYATGESPRWRSGND
jgi:hypothetical protein